MHTDTLGSNSAKIMYEKRTRSKSRLDVRISDRGESASTYSFRPKLGHGLNMVSIYATAKVPERPHIMIQSVSYKPLVLVDTATREGMSGSPVLIRHDGLFKPPGELTLDLNLGTSENLFGIYSGRIGEDELVVQLGRVWKLKVIEEMFTNGVPGLDPVHAI